VRLLVYHFIGDWLLQPNDWSKRKYKENKILVLHTLLYTAVMAIPLFSYDNFFLSLVIVFITHLIIDSRKPVVWWLKNINKTEVSFIYVLLVDQIFHIIIIYLLGRYL
jgi:hypothetical protein